jgi:hypothetical protein
MRLPHLLVLSIFVVSPVLADSFEIIGTVSSSDVRGIVPGDT